MTFTLREVAVVVDASGLDRESGDYITEIGCTELIDGQITESRFHSTASWRVSSGGSGGSCEVGMSGKLSGASPAANSCEAFLDYVGASDLVMHNSGFALAFVDAAAANLTELTISIAKRNQVFDTLMMARNIFPGQAKSVPAIASRYSLQPLSDNVDTLRRSEQLAVAFQKLRAEYYRSL